MYDLYEMWNIGCEEVYDYDPSMDEEVIDYDEG